MASRLASSVEEAITAVEEEIEKLKSGELDQDLAAVVLRPIPACFKAVLTACDFPDPPNITVAMVAFAMEEKADDADDPKEEDNALKTELLQLWKGINSHKYASPFR